MSNPVLTAVLPVVVALVMTGLGLALTVSDFARVVVAPTAILATLVCQVLVLPVLCFALVLAVDLEPSLALGMMVLAAAPGGVMAAVFSHVAGGDVALNVTATALNSLLSLVTVPVVTALAAARFGTGGAGGEPELGRFGIVVIAVLLPVALGMVVRARAPRIADRCSRPVRIASLLAVFLTIVAAIAPQAAGFVRGLVAVGFVCLAFSVLSLAVGYVVPRVLRVGHPQAVAAAMEMGVHNAVVALTVTTTVLQDPRAAIAPAMYGALMFGPPSLLAWLLARRRPSWGAAGARR